MRILFAQEIDWIKQNLGQQHHLAEMLSLRGNEVHVIDCEILQKSEGSKGLFLKRKVFEKISSIHKDANITVIRPGIMNLPIIKYISLFFSHRNEVNRQIIEFKPEVIVGWGIINSYLAANAAKKNAIPFIYYWIDVLHLLIPNRLFRPLGKIVEKKAVKKADLVLTINEKLKDYVLSLGAVAERIKVIRAGFELERFDANLHGMNIRQQYGLNNQDRVLFFMGWLYNFSGLDDVIQALSKRKDFRLKLFIVGEGDAYDDLEILRGRYKLDNRVILAGKKEYSEIPGLIATADVCILPADPSEPIMQNIVPIKIYEYMAMKKPVITTKLPGIMKEFGEGNGVIYVDQPEDVVKAAEDLLNSGYANLIKLGLTARQHVERNSWEKVFHNFEVAASKVVEGKAVGN